MKILVLEDDGSIAISIKNNLEPRYEVLTAYSIYDAREIIDNNEIDLYVVDFNLDPDGLEDAELPNTNGGMFTGWIFLTNYVFPKDVNLRNNHQIIVYTDYLDQFRKSYTDKKLYENISLFDKTHDPADLIIKEIKKVLKCIESKKSN